MERTSWDVAEELEEIDEKIDGIEEGSVQTLDKETELENLRFRYSTLFEELILEDEIIDFEYKLDWDVEAETANFFLNCNYGSEERDEGDTIVFVMAELKGKDLEKSFIKNDVTRKVDRNV